MHGVMQFWGFGPDVCADALGPDRPLHQVAGKAPTPLFGRVTLADELIERCDAYRDQAAAGWWTWLLLDPSAAPPGEPVAWFTRPTGDKHPIVVRPAAGAYHFAFDVDGTTEFIRNERYLTHAPPGYLRLGINPDRLPHVLRKFAFRALHSVRSVRGRRGPVFPAAGESAVDIWHHLIRTLVEERWGRSVDPMWPGGKRFAVIVSGDIDTDYCLKTARALDGCRAALDTAGMRAAWMVVGKLAAAGRMVLDELHRQGHEIGYHGLHHDHRLAFLPPDRMAARMRGAQGLVQRYGATGFRSPNYLRTDELYRAVDSVLSYDMSMHDAVARASGLSPRQEGCATCFPFRIAGTGLTEIPITVPEDWDLELSGCTADQACDHQMAAITRLRERGGVAHVCIHPEPQFTLRPDWLRAHARLLAWVAEDEAAWLTRPGDIDRHWRAREARIAGQWDASASATEPSCALASVAEGNTALP